MHIPDGLLSGPVCLATGVISLGAVGYALVRLRNTLGDRVVPLMGVMSAGIFAAQMVNFPILTGTSGHVLGGVLATVTLGPWAGAVSLTVVLVMQCLLFYDGGVTALGANTLNMAVIGSMVGYMIYAPVRRLIAGPSGVVLGSVVAAWFAVVLAAVACSVELAASGQIALPVVLPSMTLVHMAIGLGEAAVTGLVIGFLVQVRPDLIYGYEQQPGPAVRTWQWIGGGLAVSLVVAVFLAPFASEFPDGLEKVAEDLSFLSAARDDQLAAPMPGYEIPALEGLWMATSVVGLIGTLAVFVMAWLLARGVRLGQRGEIPTDA